MADENMFVQIGDIFQPGANSQEKSDGAKASGKGHEWVADLTTDSPWLVHRAKWWENPWDEGPLNWKKNHIDLI